MSEEYKGSINMTEINEKSEKLVVAITRDHDGTKEIKDAMEGLSQTEIFDAFIEIRTRYNSLGDLLHTANMRNYYLEEQFTKNKVPF